jgi:hypothetical protein
MVRWAEGVFEVVVARGNVKVRHLARNPMCVLVVSEVVPPFRGIEVRGRAELAEFDVTPMGRAIAARELGLEGGARFAEARPPLAECTRVLVVEVDGLEYPGPPKRAPAADAQARWGRLVSQVALMFVCCSQVRKARPSSARARGR